MQSNRGLKTPQKKANTLAEIEKLRLQREARRKAMTEARAERAAEEKRLTDLGMPGDVDFQRMIADWRTEREGTAQRLRPAGNLKICICVRKRPVSQKEIKKKDFDSVTCLNPRVVVHDCKLKVDGITKYLDNTEFAFDYAFHEDVGTEDVYLATTQPLVDFILRKGRATVFAYGQTGSGKTYTMAGIQEYVAQDLFAALDQDDSHGLLVGVSFFEIYGGRCQYLLNHRHRLEVREDGKGEVNIAGLEEVEVRSYEDLLGMIELGNRNRTTHATEANDVSSRSHAICQVTLRSAEDGKVQGKLSLIDLAGSERAADTRSHNRQRRMEGAEINKSLLALKECIRALDNNSGHVPYRASKLTLVLKDSFTNKNAKTVMIATVSPTASSADHTLNTLRYADRVKEKSVDLPLPIDLASRDAAQERSRAADNSADDALFEERRGRLQLASERAGRQAPPSGRGDGQPPRQQQQPQQQQAQQAPRRVQRQPQQPQYYDDDEYDDLLDAGDDDAYHQQQHRGGRQVPERRSSANDDIEYLAATYKNNTADSEEVAALHQTVQSLFEEEEALLNMHMNVIQENAELLTEEGQLLQNIQGDEVVDYDIDNYAARLEQILQRKMDSITMLQKQLAIFRKHLEQEESTSKRIQSMPQY